MNSDIFYTGIDEAQLLDIFAEALSFTAVIWLALAVAMYILNALGLYKVAHRRGIKNSWLAWIPLGDYWILGSIADHYRRTCRGETTNRRVLLLALYCAYTVITAIQLYYLVQMLMSFWATLESVVLTEVSLEELEAILGEFAQRMAVFEVQMGENSAVGMVVSLLSIAVLVFYYICLHDFYASCRPEKKTMFLVLSIFFSVTIPFFVFYCRYAELGMPPKDENQEYILPPAQPSELPEDTDGSLWRDS